MDFRKTTIKKNRKTIRGEVHETKFGSASYYFERNIIYDGHLQLEIRERDDDLAVVLI
jgi:hypothetical protein